MKAGLMEIADLFVVNKKDLRGFERYITDLDGALDMREWKRRRRAATLARHRRRSCGTGQVGLRSGANGAE